MADVWLKAFSWTKLGPALSVRLSNNTALQPRRWVSHRANCMEKSAAVEVTVTSTASSSLRATSALPPAVFSSAIRFIGLRASKSLAAAGLAAGGLAGAGLAAAGGGFGGEGFGFAAPMTRMAAQARARI